MSGPIEQTHVFECEGRRLVGISTAPAEPAACGVLVIVGGPQYRVGSHRQFVLLARELAASGIAAFRFDYRGMGDSEGEAASFESIEPDIRAAIDAFRAGVPGVRRIVLWGLCDAASAALMYAHLDARVAGLVLLNPWFRSQESHARTVLRHYYLSRLLEPSTWSRLLRGRLNLARSAREILARVRDARGRRSPVGTAGASGERSGAAQPRIPFRQRMLAGLRAFEGPVLLIVSGDDLTAAEFVDGTAASRPWRRALARSRLTKHRIDAANHTFASRAWRAQVSQITRDWIRECVAAS